MLGSGLEPAERAQLRKPVRTILRALRARHGVPTWRWYTLNTLVQGSLFLSLTGGLSVMSAALWPGLVDQGTLYFKDLTAPPLYPQHLSTPYGTMGTVLPLLGVLMHVRAVDNSAAGACMSMSTVWMQAQNDFVQAPLLLVVDVVASLVPLCVCIRVWFYVRAGGRHAPCHGCAYCSAILVSQRTYHALSSFAPQHVFMRNHCLCCIAVRTQSVSWASRLLILPVYLMALVQPHAVLLYWLTMGATHLAITGPLSKRGALSRAFGIPAMLLPDAPSADSGSSAGSSSSSSAAASEGDGELVKGDNILSDPSLLVAVGSDFLSHRNAAAAAACFSKAVSAAEGFGNEVVRGEAYLGLARAQLKQQQMAEAQAAAGQLEGLLQGSLAGMLFAGDEGATKLQAGLESVQQELKAAGKQ